MLAQKSVFAIFVSLMLLVSLMPAFVVAEEGSSTDTNTDSTTETDSDDDSDDSDDDTDVEDEAEDEDEIEDEEDESDDEDDSEEDRLEDIREMKEERLKKEFKHEFTTEDGRHVVVERKVEIEDGKRKIIIIRKVTNADGSVSEYRLEIIEKDGKRLVKFEGRGDFDVETDLEVDQGENESDLEVTDSEGKRHKIKVMPDRASEVAIERLRSKNFTVELREIEHKNVPRVVYVMESNKNGKFLGIFKTKVKVEGQIDPETGEVIGVNKPWWAVLVAGEDDADETVTEETNGEVESEMPAEGNESVEEMIVENETTSDAAGTVEEGQVVDEGLNESSA